MTTVESDEVELVALAIRKSWASQGMMSEGASRIHARAAIAALRSRPAVVDAEVMAVVKELDELRRLSLAEYALRGRDVAQHNAYVDALVEHWPALSAALRFGRTK